ncbi:MAG: DUF3558 family protein [Actinomadura sp.]
MDWTAIGSLAAVASAVFAFLTYQANHGGDSKGDPARTPSTPTSDSLYGLPHPCEIPSITETSRFDMEAGKPVNPGGIVGCTWRTHVGDPGKVDILHIIYSSRRHAYDLSVVPPVSVAGVSGAIEARSPQGGCDISWNTSFGHISIWQYGRDETVDPCAVVEDFANAVGPKLPR